MSDAQLMAALAEMKTPDGWRAAPFPGWVLPGSEFVRRAGGPSVQLADVQQVKLAGESYPDHFCLVAWTTDESFAVELLFDVDEQAQEIHFVGGLALAGGELDQALTRLFALKPLGWWKRKAQIYLSLLVDPQHEAATQDALRRLVKAAEAPMVRRRDRITPGLLEEVARVYREAWAAGQSPTRAVREHFGKSQATAGRWVGLARQHGFLGPAAGPIGGEADG